MHTYTFTGHRPKDLPRGMTYSDAAKDIREFLAMSPKEIQFITGGALGIDSWAAEFAMREHIPFTLALPFEPTVMSAMWPDVAVERLLTHMRAAQAVHIIHHGGYDIRAYQERNVYMVDHANEVLAFWTGKVFGGTANCIRYALKKNVPVTNLLDGPYRGQVKELR